MLRPVLLTLALLTPSATAAPPNVVAEQPSLLAMADPVVPGTYRAVYYLCVARAEKEAKLTIVRCEVSDSSGGAPVVKEAAFPGPVAAIGDTASGIIAPAQVCTYATALFEVDGHAHTETDGPSCRPVGPG